MVCSCSKFEYFNQVVPGELTIVTGIPNSGKSEWIDALLCNLNETAGWKFALCSMENRVSQFMVKFAFILVCYMVSCDLGLWSINLWEVGTVLSWGFTQWLVETVWHRQPEGNVWTRYTSCWIYHLKYLKEFYDALNFLIQEERVRDRA